MGKKKINKNNVYEKKGNTKILFKFLMIIFVLCILEGTLRLWGWLYLKNYHIAHKSKENISQESKTIVCLGESSTNGLWVPVQDSYPAQLEWMLRAYFNSNEINVIVPPHLGQNTSQMANRINHYIKLYRPKVIVMMVGCNNHWSLTESHISKFLPPYSLSAIKMDSFIFLNNFRLFKLIRYSYLFIKQKGRTIIEGLPFKLYIAGEAQKMHHLPPEWVLNCFNNNIKHFIELWEYDVELIIKSAKDANIPIIFMTYPIPISIPTEEFLSIAEKEKVILIRNDLDFENFKDNGKLSNYIFSYDNWHPTEKGYTVIAKNVFDVIIKNNLLFDNFYN